MNKSRRVCHDVTTSVTEWHNAWQLITAVCQVSNTLLMIEDFSLHGPFIKECTCSKQKIGDISDYLNQSSAGGVKSTFVCQT